MESLARSMEPSSPLWEQHRNFGALDWPLRSIICVPFHNRYRVALSRAQFKGPNRFAAFLDIMGGRCSSLYRRMDVPLHLCICCDRTSGSRYFGPAEKCSIGRARCLEKEG